MSNSEFVSSYYPIKFTPSDRYVFYESLIEKSRKSPFFTNFVERINRNLYGAYRNPTRGNNSRKIRDALEFLKEASYFELQKEKQFFESQIKKHPELKEYFDKCKTNGDYTSFIVQLNSTLHGAELFKKETETEIKRIDRYKKANKYYLENKERVETLKSYEHTKSSYKGELTSAEKKDREELSAYYHTRENYLTEGGTEFSADNPYFALNGEEVFNSIFSSQSYMSTLTTAVVEKYGKKLFTYQSGKLKINPRQLTALVKLLTDKAYELLLLNEGGFKKGKKGGDARGHVRNENLRRAGRVVESADFQNFIDGLLNAPEEKDLFSSLDKIADQYSLPMESLEEVKVSKGEITSLKNKLKKAYDKEKAAAQKGQFASFSQWRKQIGATDADLERMTALSKSAKVQLYYTNEGMSVTDLLRNDVTYAFTTNGKNLTDDVQAGYLMVKSSVDESSFKKITQKASRDMSRIQEKAINNMRKTEGVNDIRKNAYELRKAREEQTNLLKKANQEINDITDGVKDVLSQINIHTTVKGYKSIGAGRHAFEGAAFGSDIIEQATALDDVAFYAGLDSFDRDWLIFALINCGTGMIGSQNKTDLEDYLSIFASMLMFNDAYLIADDVRNFMHKNYTNTTVKDIHLYVLNNVYIPNSYILKETYDALSKTFLKLESEISGGNHGINLTLTTYNTGYNKTFSLEELDLAQSGNAWEKESETALKTTKLTMTFMAGFLDILRQINDAMPQNS